MASLAEIQALVEQIKNDLPLLINRSQIAPKQVVIVNGLSDMSERLGLVQAGEFRTGNGKEPGFNFNGVRIGYPAFAYDNDVWHFAGVNADVLQVGINADDGKLYFGAGTGLLNAGGIEIRASGLFINSNGYKFVDADNPDNIMGGLYAIVRHDAINDVFVELRAQPEDGTLTVVTASVDSVAGSTAHSRLTADSGGYAGNASMLILEQTAASRKLYTTDVFDHRFDGGGVFNESLADYDFAVYGIGDGVDDAPALWVDAGFNRTSMGYEHYFGIDDGSTIYLNERGRDIDLLYKDSTGQEMLTFDAGIGRATSFAWDGWRKIDSSVEPWTRTGNHQFTTPANRTTKFRKGTFVRYADGGGFEYGVVQSSSYDGGTNKTTVNLIANTSYTLDADPSDMAVSYILNPEGFPSSFQYTYTASAASGTITSYTQQVGYWEILGNGTIRFTGAITVTNNGTGSGAFRVTIPVTAVNFSAGVGRENAITGNELQIISGAGSTLLQMFFYNNGYPAANGYQITFSIALPYQ